MRRSTAVRTIVLQLFVWVVVCQASSDITKEGLESVQAAFRHLSDKSLDFKDIPPLPSEKPKEMAKKPNVLPEFMETLSKVQHGGRAHRAVKKAEPHKEVVAETKAKKPSPPAPEKIKPKLHLTHKPEVPQVMHPDAAPSKPGVPIMMRPAVIVPPANMGGTPPLPRFPEFPRFAAQPLATNFGPGWREPMFYPQHHRVERNPVPDVFRQAQSLPSPPHLDDVDLDIIDHKVPERPHLEIPRFRELMPGQKPPSMPRFIEMPPPNPAQKFQKATFDVDRTAQQHGMAVEREPNMFGQPTQMMQDPRMAPPPMMPNWAPPQFPQNPQMQAGMMRFREKRDVDEEGKPRVHLSRPPPIPDLPPPPVSVF